MSEGREFIAKTRLYNNLLREARIEAGCKTCMDLGRAVYPDGPEGRWLYVAQLESFTVKPTRKCTDGGFKWREVAVDIACFLNLDPEQLWPPEFQKVSSVKPVFRLLSLDEAKQIAGHVDPLALLDENPGPEEQFEIKELKQQVERALSRLTPREQKILRMRFGIGEKSDHTLEEVGQEFKVQKERIRQIEAKALRHLRHPHNSNLLRPFHHDSGLSKKPEREVDPREPFLAENQDRGIAVKKKLIRAERAKKAALEKFVRWRNENKEVTG